MRLCRQVSQYLVRSLQTITTDQISSLPEGVDDTRLEAEVTRHFSRFGTVFVKIRRDARNMPFAFCQYTVSIPEKFAIGTLADRHNRRRMTRREPWFKAKASSSTAVLVAPKWCAPTVSISSPSPEPSLTITCVGTYIIHRFDGDDLDVEEARSALEDAGLGAMNKCVELPYDAQCALGMNKAVLFELQKFDPAKEVQSVSGVGNTFVSTCPANTTMPGLPTPSPLPCHGLRPEEGIAGRQG